MFLKTYARGGQVSMHNLRLIRQVFGITLVLTLFCGVATFGLKTWFDFNSYERSSLQAYYWAEFKLSIPFGGEQRRSRMTQYYTYPNGSRGIVRSKTIVNDPWHKQLIARTQTQLISNAWLCVWVMGFVFLVISAGWFYSGYAKNRKKILSGGEIVTAKQLTRLIARDASPFTIGGVPMRRDSETQHLMLCGTTGTGKSLALFDLLKQIRGKRQKAVIIDTSGEVVERFYREGKDILLNPFDDRSAGYNPWRDCASPYHYDQIASTFIPANRTDPFWSDAARAVFSEALKTGANIPDFTLQKLLDVLLKESMAGLHNFLKDTVAAALVDPAIDKLSGSIRTNLATYLKTLIYMDSTREAFSIRDWIINEPADDQWVFITAQSDQRETLRPFLTAVCASAFNAMMACPESRTRKQWFIIDELASMQKQEALATALAEIRKRGGCIAIGLQNTSQIESYYGRSEAESIVSLLNTQVVFRTAHPGTARTLSFLFGEQDVLESMESLSYGVSEIRDGVSLSQQHKTKPLVSATDIMRLENREAYLKLPGNYPVAKINIELPKVTKICENFVPTPRFLQAPVNDQEYIKEVEELAEQTASVSSANLEETRKEMYYGRS